MNSLNIKNILLTVFVTTGLIACNVDVGGNEDKTIPSITLTSLNSSEEIMGTFSVTWTTNEPNPSVVDIYLSSDSGTTYPTTVDINIPDTGSYSWDTNTVSDCRNCRLRIIPRDVVGNEGEPAESAEDFIINNVPQVLGVAYYSDLDNNGFDGGDEIRVPFDKEIEIRTSIASDIFFFPVLGDNIGPVSIVRKGANSKELIITMDTIRTNSNYRLHIGGTFKNNKLNRTAPSGINLQDNISEGIIFSPDTGRTAAIAKLGIDILPAFTESDQMLGSDDTRSVALSDVDNDGDLDIVIGNIGANRVWFNGGMGVYTDSGQTLGSSSTSSIALGDVDGDGDLDMVTGNTGSSTNNANHVWLNGGDSSGSNTGIFTDSGQMLGSNFTSSIALGDVDGDGDLDIVVGNIGANRVWFNGGAGVFTDSVQILSSGNTLSIALDDVDGDGDLDMVASEDDTDLIWLNGGDSSGSNTGVFTDSGQALDNNHNHTQSIALGDVDGDGDIDLVTGNHNANRVWLNGGDSSGSNTGIFTDSNQALGNSNTQSIALADVDNDGDLDMVTGNDNANRVWLNGGDSSGSNTGIFTDSDQTLGNGNTQSIALGDVDGDGDLDMVTGNTSRLWLNSLRYPSAAFMLDSGQALGNAYTQSIALGDMDGDGDLDIVTGNFGANEVWLNGGDSSSNTGIFTDSGQMLGSNFTSSIALGDVDGDGDLDMVTGNDNANRVWLNGGDNSGSNTGVFTDSGQMLGNDITSSIALGDIDGDGDLDIAVGNAGEANRIWLNGGDNSGSNTGIFTDSGQALGSSNTQSIALGDLDGDGDLDMVVGNDSNTANNVWLNDGKGRFSSGQAPQGYNDSYSIALGDIDGDGDLDVVTGNFGANEVWLNGGDSSGSNTGVFTDSGQMLGNDITSSIALGDLDGDGDLDMAVGNTGAVSTGGANRVWLNGGDSSSNTGSFITNSKQALGNEPTPSIALGDIDDDGDLDIVTGNNGTNYIWLNDY